MTPSMMRHPAWLLLMTVWAASSMAQAPAKEPKIPKSKWINGSRDYEEARELQKATGADMIVYFGRTDMKDEKGLCSWWESRGMNDGQVGRFLEDYIKVRVELPFRNNKEEEKFTSFRFNKTPAIFVVRPDHFPQRIQVFDWTNGKPDLHDPEKIIELIRERSTARSGDAPARPKK